MSFSDNEIEIFYSSLAENVRLLLSDGKTTLKNDVEKYLKTKSISDLSYLSIYFILSRLSDEEQVLFVKDNAKYFGENSNNIFLYEGNGIEPLVKFMSYNSIKELYKINNENFSKLIKVRPWTLLAGFSNSNIIEFYEEFYEEITKMDDNSFINGFYNASVTYWDNVFKENITKARQELKEEGNKFWEYFLEKYEDRISRCVGRGLLSILTNSIDHNIDNQLLQSFVDKNKVSLQNTFATVDFSTLFDQFEGLNARGEMFILSNFYDNIVPRDDLPRLVSCLSDETLVYLFNQDKNIISRIPINQFLRNRVGEKHKEIIEAYNLDNLEEIFSIGSYVNKEAAKYVEQNFLEKIKVDGVIAKLDGDTSIFSKEYLKNIKEMSVLIKSREVTRNSDVYKAHFKIFANYLIRKYNFGEINDMGIKELEKLFFRIVKTSSFSILKSIRNIETITMYNRTGNINWYANNFSVEQLVNYNVKEHNKLCKIIRDNNKEYHELYDMYVLKLMFLVGYERAKYILTLDPKVTTLEHLVGHVSVKDIKLDENGNPILNEKIINLLFRDVEHNRIKFMLENKDSDLYKYFPRIFSEWEIIKLSNKEYKLDSIIEFLKNGDVSLPPKYYRLEGLFKLIGRNNDIVMKTFKTHDEMLKRVESTIPRVKGSVNGYDYEVLRLDDMEGLTVGSVTNCCFTINGASKSSLNHALTNKNGRILTVKKDGVLLAHSWLWRNGNLLCLDNIEISKKIKKVDFLEVYEDLADKIIDISYEVEGAQSCIKNITIGNSVFDKNLEGISKYPCFIKDEYKGDSLKDFSKTEKGNYLKVLPLPVEQGLYSDAKAIQWLIRGEGNFKFFDSECFYCDERKAVLSFEDGDTSNKDKMILMNKQINGLRNIKLEQENRLDEYKNIDIRYLDKAYCNDDWYVLVDKKGNLEYFIWSKDDRATEELNSFLRIFEKKTIR